jgi:hypothetical protein
MDGTFGAGGMTLTRQDLLQMPAPVSSRRNLVILAPGKKKKVRPPRWAIF